jgi:hypothetical protein
VHLARTRKGDAGDEAERQSVAMPAYSCSRLIFGYENFRKGGGINAGQRRGANLNWVELAWDLRRRAEVVRSKANEKASSICLRFPAKGNSSRSNTEAFLWALLWLTGAFYNEFKNVKSACLSLGLSSRKPFLTCSASPP